MHNEDNMAETLNNKERANLETAFAEAQREFITIDRLMQTAQRDIMLAFASVQVKKNDGRIGFVNLDTGRETDEPPPELKEFASSL